MASSFVGTLCSTSSSKAADKQPLTELCLSLDASPPANHTIVPSILHTLTHCWINDPIKKKHMIMDGWMDRCQSDALWVLFFIFFKLKSSLQEVMNNASNVPRRGLYSKIICPLHHLTSLFHNLLNLDWEISFVHSCNMSGVGMKTVPTEQWQECLRVHTIKYSFYFSVVLTDKNLMGFFSVDCSCIFLWSCLF